jgi:signal transduction histidine kinase/ActR/RegA family two-component response regulator/HPt (histidine-containing phosphotransfer) domain-containing protein
MNRTIPATAAATAAIAASVLVGWVVDVSSLKSVVPGAVEMKANTAAGLLAAAVALWQLSKARPAPAGRAWAQAAALFVCLLGLLTLGQYVFGWDLGIDQALFTDHANRFNVLKGRMSPYTAAALACMGSALFVLLRAGPVRFAYPGALVALCIGTISTIGYGWNATELTTDAVLPPVAINTAIALIFLASGTLVAARKRSLERDLVHPAARFALTYVESKVLLGLIASFVMLLVAGGLTYRAADAFAASTQWVIHTQHVRTSLNQLKADVAAAGLAHRHYLITGQRPYLDAHRDSIQQLNEETRQLRTLLRDNPAQTKSLDELESLIGRMHAVLSNSLAVYGSAGLRPAQSVVAEGGGVQAMSRVALLIDQMLHAEDRLLGERETASANFKQYMLVTLLCTLAVAALISAALFRSIRSHMQARHSAEEDLVRAGSAAEAARRDADAANRAKGAFLAAMSHEIRTPMNGVLGLLELLSLGKLDAEQRSTLTVVRNSGQSLLRIVDDILDFSKIEAGKLELHSQPASLTQLVERVCRIYSGAASSKGLLLQGHVDPAIAAAHCFDQLRLEQVLSNFISNAIKFTDRGTVQVSVELAARHEHAQEIHLRVKDTGIGIAPEKIKQLFEPFAQAEANISTRYGGTGLGLTICRRIAELMGGKAEIASMAGVGTTATVTVTLPIAEEADLPDHPRGSRRNEETILERRRAPPSIEQAEIEGTLLLVVDDHPTNRLVLKRQLNLLGYAVETASDGRMALAIFCTRKFRAVITDCNMPEMSGYDLARSIRAFEKATGRRRVPILACTANAMPTEAAICAEAGMDDYVVKPAQLAQLARHLDNWAPLPRTADGEGHSQPAAFHATGSLIDQSLLDSITGGNLDGQVQVLGEFMRLNREDAAHLRRFVFEEPDLDQVTHYSHRIRGSSKMLGASALAAASQAIEAAARAGDMSGVQSCLSDFERELLRLDSYVGDRLGAPQDEP